MPSMVSKTSSAAPSRSPSSKDCLTPGTATVKAMADAKATALTSLSVAPAKSRPLELRALALASA